MWLCEVLLGVVLGVALGLSAYLLLRVSRRWQLYDKESLIGFTAMICLLVWGLGRLLNMGEIFVAFITGLTLGWPQSMWDKAHEDQMVATIDRSLSLSWFVLLGTALPVTHWTLLPAGRTVLVVVLVLLLRRLPWLLLLKLFRIVPVSLHSWKEALFIGWFGPIGSGAVFYSALAFLDLQDETYFIYVTVLVLSSLLAHGLSASLLTRITFKSSDLDDPNETEVEDYWDLYGKDKNKECSQNGSDSSQQQQQQQGNGESRSGTQDTEFSSTNMEV